MAPSRSQIGKRIKRIYLEKNRYYRGFAIGNVDQVQLYFSEPNLNRYLDNNIDWCRIEDQADLLTHYPEETFVIQQLGVFFLGFACHQPPFNHKLVRQAFAKSIDQKELVEEVWANVQRPGALAG